MAQKQYNVQGPDGKAHVIEGPNNATDDEIIAQAKRLFGGPAAPATPAAPKEDLNAIRLAQAKKYRTGEEMAGTNAVNATTGIPTPSPHGVGLDIAGGLQGPHAVPTPEAYPRVNRAMNTMWGDMNDTANLIRHPLDSLDNAARAGEAARVRMLRREPNNTPGLLETVAGPTVERIQKGQYPEAIGGIGAAVTEALIPGAAEEAAGGIVGAAKGALQKTRVAVAGGPSKYIEQQIAPTGKEAQVTTGQISQPLATENPELLRLKDVRFNQQLFQNFKEAETGLHAAEATVRPGTVVAKKNILAGLDTRIADLQVPGAPTAAGPTLISGHPDAVKTLIEARNAINAFPDHIPFEDLLKYKRQLDKSIYTGGGFKETATAAERAVMEARRAAVDAVRAELNGLSPELKAANEIYGRSADAVMSAGLDWNTGRKINTIGKPSTAQKVIRGAAKIAIPAVVGAAGYEAAVKHYQP